MIIRYFIKTFGCQMNEADSEQLAAVFEEQGYQVTDSFSKADIVVINTCSVREAAENRVIGLVRNLAEKKNKKQRIILTGCMVGSARGDRKRFRISQLKRKMPGVDEFKTIGELVGAIKVGPKYQKKTEALVSIMEGCDHFCTYCVVPYSRGREVSRSFKEIICEVEELVSRGYKKITLLGQNVNSYKPSFAKLLRRLHRIQGIKMISFLTSNPWDLSEEIIKAMSLPKIDRILHLPVQSGDDKVLRKMNRPYTAQNYLDLIARLKKVIPDIRFSTDIIVGFPGETKEAFENTVQLCKKVGFEKAYLARYSPRPGTAAFKLKDSVSPKEKKRRWRLLEELINQ